MKKGENIFKRKDGRWEARYIKGYELSGKIKYGLRCPSRCHPQDDLDARIIALIKKDSKISAEKLGMALGVSVRTIRRHIKQMDNVRFVGRGFSGHWEVDEK